MSFAANQTFPIKIQGDTIIVSARSSKESTWICNGEKFIFEANETIEYQMKYKLDQNGGLTLDVQGETLNFTKATSDQLARVQSLPICTKE